MSVMKGFESQGVFSNLGRLLITKAKSIFGVILILVMLCFFCSMIITNDVALITFIPFTFAVLDVLGESTEKKLAVPVVCMQTIAANLGSMLTPIGNPQNLYLYGKSGMTVSEFLLLMLPYAVASLVLLLIWIFILSRKKVTVGNIDMTNKTSLPIDSKKIALHITLFILCLLTVARILPYQVLFCIVTIMVLIFDRKVLFKIDYSLLFTFVGFFIFIGNLGRVDAFSHWLSSVISGREVPVSILASQVISNVPAALLLSSFTEDIKSLIVGTDLGGLGTLIASMASLISFRQIANRQGDMKLRYLLKFTVSNLIFLACLVALWIIIK